MKGLKKLFFFLTTISIFTACKKAPVACFTLDKSNVAVDSIIKCDASCSLHAKTYIWLGTGTKASIHENPAKETYKFSSPGNYTIQLQVMNGAKDDIVSHNISVY